MPYSLVFGWDQLPSLNTSATRRHWSVAHREVLRWRTIVSLAKPKPPSPLRSARVTLTRRSAREPDHENLCMSFKPVLDALVHCGVLVDDGPAHVERVYRWEKVKPRMGMVVVKVEEIA